MAHCSRRLCSFKCSRSRDRPDATLDDVAAVVAGLNCKVLQLRREILELRDLSESGRSDGRAGLCNAEPRKSSIESRGMDPRHDKEEMISRRKKNSQQVDNFSRKKDYSSSTPYLFEDSVKNRKMSQKAHANCHERGKCRDMSSRSVEREESSVSAGTMTRTRSTSGTSGTIFSSDTKNEATQTSVKPKRRTRISDEISDRKSPPESARQRKTSARRNSYRIQDDDARLPRVSVKTTAKAENRDEKRKLSTEYEKSRIETECAAIRHALGLSTPYCNCAPIGNTVGKVRRKRISRGVQSDDQSNIKKKTSSRLSRCFLFKCCVARAKNSKMKGLKKESENKQSPESSDAYMLKNNKNEKKHEKSQEKNGKGDRVASIKNRRIGGGAERMENVNIVERHLRRKTQAPGERWIQRNAAIHVRKRLNECLIELNEIIGDVAYMFEESNNKR